MPFTQISRSLSIPPQLTPEALTGRMMIGNSCKFSVVDCFGIGVAFTLPDSVSFFGSIIIVYGDSIRKYEPVPDYSLTIF